MVKVEKLWYQHYLTKVQKIMASIVPYRGSKDLSVLGHKKTIRNAIGNDNS